MSNRRGAPDASKAAQNQQTIKQLLKLPGNKFCADCKRNAHPRWASWNLGIFICIRCSGIHRGMGTHISRVKSVDLDAWTDEQLQSMLRWGNSRANKYWEANLAQGHVPSESKIENFIRTKYDSKRWVMEGGIPDPSTLNDSDEDDTPLRVVQEKAKAEVAAGVASPPRAKPQPKAQVNLFDDDPIDMGGGSSAKTTAPLPGGNDNKPGSAPPGPKQQKPADSLLGLDFFGSPAQSPNPRPASAASNQSGAGGASRPDLNRSILSLYASAPKQTTMHQSTGSGNFSSFGAAPPQSPPMGNANQGTGGGLGGLGDAFGGLTFSPTPTSTAPPPQPQKQPSAFDNLSVGMLGRSGGGGGSMAPKPANLPNSGFFAPSKPATQTQPAAAAASSGLGDLFDFSTPAQPAPQSQPAKTSMTPSMSSFTSKPQTTSSISFDNAWSSPSTTTASTANTATSNNASALGGLGGWGEMKPATTTTTSNTVRADDDFGAFSMGGGGPASSSSNNHNTASSGTGAAKKPVAYDEDLFQNVWG